MAEPTKPVSTETQKPTSQNNAQNKDKKSLPAHYVLTVEGTAYINGAPSEYEVEVKVPDLGEGKGDGHYLSFVLSEDRGEILAKAIRKKYKDCETIRTHYLVDRKYVSANGESIPRTRVPNEPSESHTVSSMRKAELLNYIKEMKYSIDTTLYSKADELREAVTLYQEDREAFLEKQEKDLNEKRIKEETSLLND